MTSLSNYDTYEYNIQPCNTKNMNINDLLRTEHLNTEEKEKLLHICKKYSIFKHPDDKLSFSNLIKRNKY